MKKNVIKVHKKIKKKMNMYFTTKREEYCRFFYYMGQGEKKVKR